MNCVQLCAKGEMSERDTRIYQGLDSDQQRALFTAVTDGYVTSQEGKQVAQLLKKGQARSINAALRLVRAGDNEPKSANAIGRNIGNQVRLERVQALLAHVRWQGMDSAEASLTYQLLQEIEIQVADLLHHFGIQCRIIKIPKYLIVSYSQLNMHGIESISSHSCENTAIFRTN